MTAENDPSENTVRASEATSVDTANGIAENVEEKVRPADDRNGVRAK